MALEEATSRVAPATNALTTILAAAAGIAAVPIDLHGAGRASEKRYGGTRIACRTESVGDYRRGEEGGMSRSLLIKAVADCVGTASRSLLLRVKGDPAGWSLSQVGNEFRHALIAA